MAEVVTVSDRISVVQRHAASLLLLLLQLLLLLPPLLLLMDGSSRCYCAVAEFL